VHIAVDAAAKHTDGKCTASLSLLSLCVAACRPL
jgi:hypothetical protein